MESVSLAWCSSWLSFLWKVFLLHGVPLARVYGSSRGSNMESVPLAKIGSSRLPTLFFFVIETNKFLKAVVFI